ncbi:coiled-coil domain-containing protein [Mariniblastus fucicola]|uniref:Uncharacterized protein n=1 Tax=Mariniblastus fucicola TaxID=980251 RepID=A0A5B9PAF2_9BACT|nr:hypothetical protein [Mariniblastus fucicola]QEG22469.1 hypothetical protein MFFC18_23490 [Mariniblastus fucicola]
MSETQLHEYLRGTNSVQRFASLTRLLFLGLLGVLVLVAAAIGFDAALSLPTWFRVLVDAGILLAAFAAIIYFARTFLSFRFFGHRTARRIEESLEIDNNAFVNAVDLGDDQAVNVSEQLKAEVVSKGNQLSREYSPFSTVSFAPTVKALVSAGIATIAVTVFYFAAPQMFGRVLPRYLDPFGNHPAYTSLEFIVTVNPTEVEFGQTADVFVDIEGANLPKAANFVRKTEFGEEETPMMNLSEGEFHLQLSELTQRVEFMIKTERGESRSFAIDVLPIPTFEKIWVQYDYPEYTGWESQRRLLTSNGIRALERSKVTLEVESNISLESGQLILSSSDDGSEPHSMAVASGDKNRVTNTFELEDQTQFEMELLAANGTSSSNNSSGKIHVTVDRPPQIRVESPEPHVIAVEGSKVPIKLRVSDDVGLKQLTFYRSINGIGPFAKVLKSQFDETFGNETVEFDLGELGAKAGDLITYYGSISDTYPIDYPGSEEHLILCETGVIQVISLSDYQDLARREYRMDEVMDEIAEFKDRLAELQEQREKILEELEELQNKLESGEELTEEEKQRMAQLEAQLEEFAKKAAALARDLKERAEQAPIYDFEDSLQEQFKELAEQLDQQADDASALSKAMAQAATGSPSAAQSAMKKFKDNDEPFDAESEQDREDMQQDLERLAGAEDLLQQVARLKSIIDQQREIADRMKEFQAKDDLTEEEQRRLKKLAKQQDLLKQELVDTMEEIEKAAEESKDDFPKAAASMLEIVDAIAESGALDDQQSAAESGQDLDGKSAAEAAEEAAKKLEALQCDCNSNSMGTEMAQGDRPLSIPGNSMSKSLDQLAQSMKIPSMKVGKGGRGSTGYRGSISRASLFGPHSETRIRESRRRGRSGDRSKGGSGDKSIVENGFAPEQLTPEARGSESTGPANMQGVPSAYTDHARAYLKRIAEDVNPDNE